MSESNLPPRDLGAEMLEEMIKGREWTQDPNRTRDFFAAAALQGLLAAWGQHDVTDFREIAIDAYGFADAMLKARGRS
jgi:hypothetical protein